MFLRVFIVLAQFRLLLLVLLLIYNSGLRHFGQILEPFVLLLFFTVVGGLEIVLVDIFEHVVEFDLLLFGFEVLVRFLMVALLARNSLVLIFTWILGQCLDFLLLLRNDKFVWLNRISL